MTDAPVSLTHSDAAILMALLVVTGSCLIIALMIAATPPSPVFTPCTSWGTTSGKEFDPPSTEWYNKHCNTTTLNETCRMGGDICGHTKEACACYEFKHIDLWHWENTQNSNYLRR